MLCFCALARSAALFGVPEGRPPSSSGGSNSSATVSGWAVVPVYLQRCETKWAKWARLICGCNCVCVWTIRMCVMHSCQLTADAIYFDLKICTSSGSPITQIWENFVHFFCQSESVVSPAMVVTDFKFIIFVLTCANIFHFTLHFFLYISFIAVMYFQFRFFASAFRQMKLTSCDFHQTSLFSHLFCFDLLYFSSCEHLNASCFVVFFILLYYGTIFTLPGKDPQLFAIH